jgi:hypothetical protein
VKHFAPFFLPIILLFTFGSCKKNKDDSSNPTNQTYFIRCQVDGVQKEYTSQALGDYTLFQSKIYNYAVRATMSVSDASGLTFAIWMDVPVETKQYTEQILASTSAPQVFIQWVDNKSGFTSSDPRTSSDASAKITFTEITATSYRGTFSGKVKTGNGQTSHQLTQGEFLVKRIH